ncbi:diguanylate cyclase domain-containing protein [Parasphingorhabdus pacifica]
MTGQRWRFTAVGIAVVVVAAIALVVSGLVDTAVSRLVADLTGLLTAVMATAAFAWTGWRQPGDERRWRWMMALGLAGETTGQAFWTWYRTVEHHTTPFPNTQNMFYLALPIFAFFALLSVAKNERATFKHHDTASPRMALVLDGLIIGGSLLALTWEITFSAVLRAGSPTAGRLLLDVSYTMANLVLIVIAILFAVTLQSMWRIPLVWLMSGLIAIGFTEAAYVYAISNGTLPPPTADIGFMVGPVLLFVAAVTPERRFSRRVPQVPLLLLPYVPLTAVCAFTILSSARTGHANVGEIYFLVGVVVLVVLRQLVTLRQLYAAHRQLAHQATHDPLTGAANRTLLFFNLERALSRSQRKPHDLGLIYADLDHFKEFNDMLGHEAGDTALRTVAARIKDCIRRTDLLARVGGDEFVILLDPAPDDPHNLGRRIQSTLQEPEHLGDHSYVISVSLGYVPLIAGDTPDQALTRADTAMYRAKRTGRKGFSIDTGTS